MTEVELIEKAALRVGMKSLMNNGAASCVYSEGCEGVSQAHLIAFAREVALHCAAALSSPGAAQTREVPPGWKLVPVEPSEAMLTDGWDELDREDNEGDFVSPEGIKRLWAAMLAASQPVDGVQGGEG